MTSPAPTDMARWIQTFLAAIAAQNDAARNTQLAYARDLDDFATWLARRGSAFASLGQDQIETYLIACADQGLGQATRARRLSAIRQLFRFAFDEGWRADNPALQIKGPGRARRLPGTLDIAQVDRLIAAAQNSPRDGLRNDCLMQLLYATGMRVSELVSLPIAAARGNPQMLLVRGKGGKERLVPLSPPARAAMAAYLAQRDADDAQARQAGQPVSKYLFASRGAAGHLTRHRFFTLIKQWASAAGLNPADVTPHVLRHAFASHLLAGGADLRAIQTMLGHADIATTEIYTHVQDARLHDLVLHHHPLAKSRKP